MTTETAAATKLVYDFAEGSRDMRDLLGGKGANVAEMTRVLGAERVPAGFTITTEACVAYMKGGREFPDGLEEQVAEALERLEEQAEKKLGDSKDPLLVSVRAGRASRCRECSTRSSTSASNDESVEGLASDHRQRALRLGFLPALRADVRQRLPRDRGRALRGLIEERKREAGVEDDVEPRRGRPARR